ncbi:SDR family oxidoreductase [bacterium]|nr:SDR family oxidoreductase [bacterium]
MVKKSIFITGAASGIGKATALLFAEKGWFVGLYDVNESALESLAKTIGTQTCCYKKTDVTNSTSVNNAIEHFSGFTDGKMDLLFNCAGILHMGFFDEIDLDLQIKTIEVNFLGVIQCIHASLPLLKQTERSKIVNMNSSSSVYGTPELATYSATKFALKGLTEALNLEFERFGIHVCDIMVPYVNTPLLDQKRKAVSIDRLGVKTEPGQVAHLVWKASIKKKTHWSLGLKPLLLLSWLFPFAKKTMVRLVTGV